MSLNKMTVQPATNRPRQEAAAREIALQAELLALNFALEGTGGERTGEALRLLSNDLKAVLGTEPPPRHGLRLERRAG
jgi:hypothetical protein